MFSLFKKNNNNSFDPAYFPMSADMHSHILPGIDDGSPDIEASLDLIKGLMALGITKSIATPHIIGDMYRNTPETINNACVLLNDALLQHDIDFPVSAAAEYMLDAYFMEILNRGNGLLTVKDNMVLTEFSYAAMPQNIEQMAFEIITGGYTPILAHPERYGYISNDMKQFHRLADTGFLLQLNLLSLTGYYGKQSLQVANYLIKHDLVSFVATDLHHPRHMQALSDPNNRKMFQEAFGGRVFNGGLH
jgi:tyrosine-protein phosphatase YwqE